MSEFKEKFEKLMFEENLITNDDIVHLAFNENSIDIMEIGEHGEILNDHVFYNVYEAYDFIEECNGFGRVIPRPIGGWE